MSERLRGAALLLLSIALVLGAAAWSAARSRDDALADFSAQQALLAESIGAELDEPDLAEAMKELPHDVLLLVARADGAFTSSDGRTMHSARIAAALASHARSVVIPRDEAPAFGLPRRTAIAGLTHVGDKGLVVLSSAERLRDRQILEERRLAATVVIVAILVTAFGFIERRRQRQKFVLEERVAVASALRERELALAKADKMAALAALSTGIAHEVGTPLGVIMGRVEQVLDRSEDTRTMAALHEVLEQVERIRRIVRGCLALARGDAPHLVRTPPETLAQHATDLVRHRFDSAGVVLEADVDPDLPAVACEPSLFEQALVNVLLNACEATPRGGGVRLTVNAEEGKVRFIVDDDGAGIPDAVSRRAIEPFFSTRLGKGGTGLGLTIANEIVTHHSGALTLEKRVGVPGTRATIAITT